MAAASSLDGATDAGSESEGLSETEKTSAPSKDNAFHSRFGLNMGIGELLQNWGWVNLSPFHRKSSRLASPSPTNQSPQKHPQTSVKRNPDAEHIELVQLSNIKVSDVLWKNIHSKMAMPGGDVLTGMPVTAASEPLLQKLEGDEQVCSIDVLQMDEQSETQETALRNSASLVWPDEKAEEMERGIGHNFALSHYCYPTWCDRCGDLLWGLYETGYLRCRCCPVDGQSLHELRSSGKCCEWCFRMGNPSGRC